MAHALPRNCERVLLSRSHLRIYACQHGGISPCINTTYSHIRPHRGSHQLYSTSASPPSPPRFTFAIAAAYSGKPNIFNKSQHHHSFDSSTNTHHTPLPLRKSQRVPSGQDAFFISPIGSTPATATAFGVADGVGGYQDSGIDSAAFSHGLCKHMQDSARAIPEPFRDTAGSLRPLDLLQRGYMRLCADASVIGGGSTACVAVAEPDGTLEVANLGDSGFAHLRLNAVHHHSTPQTHAFNTPFQLARMPPKVLAQVERLGGKVPFTDMPADASVSSHRLRHGDVLVFATDGVWDNLSVEEVLERVSAGMVGYGAWGLTEEGGFEANRELEGLVGGGGRVEGRVSVGGEVGERMEGKDGKTMPLHTALAVDITAKAKAASVNMKRDGPFAKAVQAAYPRERFHGGKIDDICVVVLVAVDRSV